jgi:hypothetical protein
MYMACISHTVSNLSTVIFTKWYKTYYSNSVYYLFLFLEINIHAVTKEVSCLSAIFHCFSVSFISVLSYLLDCARVVKVSQMKTL